MRACEAMVRVQEVWARCGRRPVENHHRLTRARGGLLLDAAGETYHLMDLCVFHHKLAHDAPANENGLLIDGYITTIQGNVHYEGSDSYLLERYG